MNKYFHNQKLYFDIYKRGYIYLILIFIILIFANQMIIKEVVNQDIYTSKLNQLVMQQSNLFHKITHLNHTIISEVKKSRPNKRIIIRMQEKMGSLLMEFDANKKIIKDDIKSDSYIINPIGFQAFFYSPPSSLNSHWESFSNKIRITASMDIEKITRRYKNISLFGVETSVNSPVIKGMEALINHSNMMVVKNARRVQSITNVLMGVSFFVLACTVYIYIFPLMKRLQRDRKKMIEYTSELEILANIDMLTGLYNRTYLVEQFNRLCENLSTGDQLVLLILDLDDFKPVNDNYGHHAGDEILSVVGQRLLGSIRKEDMAARIGGDEFALLCTTNGDEKFINTLVERINNEFKKIIPYETHLIKISCSIGSAIYPKNASTFQDLYRYADAKMYKNKK